MWARKIAIAACAQAIALWLHGAITASLNTSLFPPLD
jgi:hypothetical protein